MSKILSLFIFLVLFVDCQQTSKQVNQLLPDSITQVNKAAQNDAEETNEEQATYVSDKQYLDSIFKSNQQADTFTLDMVNGAIHIGHLFTKTDKDAVFGYFENDSVLNVTVLRRSANKWDTLLKERICPATPGDLFVESAYTFSDFNDDGFPDLKIVKDRWNYHISESSDLWLYNNGRFNKVKGFDNIFAAEYDPETKLIYSYRSMGCADMNMYFGVFKIEGNKVKTVKEMSCACCEGDSCNISVKGQQSYNVPLKQAYKYVPAYYAEGVKEKCKEE